MTVSEHRDRRLEEDRQFAAAAQTVWGRMTTDEKTLVRFGMFPIEIDGLLKTEFSDLGELRESGRRWAVALMDCATKDGGMRA